MCIRDRASPPRKPRSHEWLRSNTRPIQQLRSNNRSFALSPAVLHYLCVHAQLREATLQHMPRTDGCLGGRHAPVTTASQRNTPPC
eukprot:2025098-Pyramimonas_sp.AAC.1